MALFGPKNSQKTTTSSQPRNGNQDQPNRPGFERLAWLGLKASDVMAEALFLEQTLGLKYLDEGNSATGHHVRYDCGTLELELVSGGITWANRPKPRRGQPDLPLIPSFQLDNIQHFSSQLHEREVLMTQIYEQGWAASFMFFDPERNLWQANETRTEAPVNTEVTTRLGAIWLAVEDFSAQLQFYRDVLGLPLVEEVLSPPAITVEAERQQTEKLELEQATLSQLTDNVSPPPHNLNINSQASRAVGAEEVALKPLSAIFFKTGVRLALSPGGTALAGRAARVWGTDTAFLPGLKTNDLPGMLDRLQATGVATSGPFAYTRLQKNGTGSYTPIQVFRFVDPEGHVWQVFE